MNCVGNSCSSYFVYYFAWRVDLFTGNPILAPPPRADVARVPRGFCCFFFLSALSVFGVNFFHLSYLLKPASSRWHQHMFATGGIALHLVWRMWIPQVLRIRKTVSEKYMFYNTRLRYFEFKINTKIKLIEQKINF